MTQHEDIRKRLTDRLEELKARLIGIEEALDAPATKDVEDRATEREDDEAMEHLGNAGLGEMRQIEAALHRIDEGIYGICVNCGENILPARLNAVPFAARCRTCAREQD